MGEPRGVAQVIYIPGHGQFQDVIQAVCSDGTLWFRTIPHGDWEQDDGPPGRELPVGCTATFDFQSFDRTIARVPDDVADAVEQMKLVVLSHKLSGWDGIAREELVGTLQKLVQLAEAPSYA